jgi:hypothetical protein
VSLARAGHSSGASAQQGRSAQSACTELLNRTRQTFITRYTAWQQCAVTDGHEAGACSGATILWVGRISVQDAMGQLSGTLLKRGQDLYCFPCRKAVLFVKLVGARTLVRFAAHDELAFRIDTANLTVENLRTRTVLRTFAWDRIESVAMGEPESDNSYLFQG